MDCKTAQQNIMPYIEKKLNNREMEAFIEHIRGCEACSEELEVYFTIYYALEQLDDKEQEQDSFDIKTLLEKNLEQSEHRIANRRILQFYRKLLIAVAAVLAAVVVFTGAQIVLRGSFEETTLYNLFSAQEEETPSPVSADSHTEAKEDSVEEPETNRKNQFIVTTPETESWVRETAVTGQ